MKKFALGLVIPLLLSLISPNAISQSIKQHSVVTTGSGRTEKDAIKDALVTAIAQVKGISISSKEMVQIREQIQNENTNSNTNYQSNINSQTSGVISSFEVLESEKSKLMGGYKVKVKANIPSYNTGPQINRLRLAVTPFRISKDIRDVNSAEKYAKTWANTLEEGLVQSRRFAMLDRSFTEITNKEIQQYTNGHFSNSELARLGQRAGADYLVTGELRKFSTIDKSVNNPLTGERIVRNNLNVELSLRLIDVATGQVKYAKTYAESKVAIQDIVNAIYPMAVVSVSNDEVVIGHGGDDIKVGQKYRVISLGQDLKDPYSGESLGRQETSIGEIEISEVQSKMSTAKIISGKQQIAESFAMGLILRPPLKSPPPAQQIKKKKNKSEDEW